MNKEKLNCKVIALKAFMSLFATSFIMSAKSGLSSKVSNDIALMQMQNTDIPLMVNNAFGKVDILLTIMCIIIWILMFWKEIKHIFNKVKNNDK